MHCDLRRTSALGTLEMKAGWIRSIRRKQRFWKPSSRLRSAADRCKNNPPSFRQGLALPKRWRIVFRPGSFSSFKGDFSGWVRRPLFFGEIQRLLQEWQVLLSRVFHEVFSCGESPTNRLVTLSFNSSHFFPSNSFNHQTLTLEDLYNRGHSITNQKNALLGKIPQIHHINCI